MRVVGACMIQLETAYKTATIGVNTYLDTTNDPLLLIAKEHEKKNKTKQNKTKKYPYLARLQFSIFNLLETLEPENDAQTFYARKVRQKARFKSDTAVLTFPFRFLSTPLPSLFLSFFFFSWPLFRRKKILK